MVLPSERNNGRRRTAEAIRSYELREIREFERGTAEADMVKSVLGEPVANTTEMDVSALPLVIVGYDLRKIAQFLSEQRENPESSLRPIAVVGVNDVVTDISIQQMADVALPARPVSDDLRETWNTLDTLATQVKRIRLAPQDRPLTLLQFLYTRGAGSEPVVDASSPVAYRYPLAEKLMAMKTVELKEIVGDMADHGILEGRHVDRLFTCPGCGGYSLPVKELCSECHSSDISVQESIHHFRCGYVAPESEFMRDGRGSCPKCRMELKHIGVEYNRPGRFVTCQECGFWASEPDLRAWCPECDAHHVPADLIPIQVESFSLAHAGARVARSGAWNPDERVEPVLEAGGDAPPIVHDTVPDATSNKDRELVSLALDLARQTDRPMSVFRALILLPLDDLDINEVEELREDVRAVLRDCVRESDMIVDIKENEFLLLIPRVEVDSQSVPSLKGAEKAVRQKLGLRLRISEVSLSEEQAESDPLRARR